MPSKFSSVTSAIWFCLATPILAAEAPVILPRAEWQAKPPAAEMAKHIPSAILIHHTGSAQKIKTTLAQKMRGLQRFSQAKEKLADGRTKPAWPDVPYHYYVSADGSIAEGRDINAVGDTNTAYSPSGFIQVVVEGNFESETLNAAQAASLTSLLQWLKQKHSIKNTAIQAHKDKAQTACPGKNLLEKLPGIVANLK